MHSLYPTVYTLNAISTARPPCAACYPLDLLVTLLLIPQFTDTPQATYYGPSVVCLQE